MARPRKPSATLELRGAFKKDPARGRDRADEPRPTGPIGEAPDTLDALSISIWDEMAVAGFWLTDADRFLLEIASKLMANFRYATTALEAKDISVLVGTLNKLGFGPAERSKIKAPGAKNDEPTGFKKFKS